MKIKQAKMKFPTDLLLLRGACDIATFNTLCKQVPNLPQGLQNLQSVEVFVFAVLWVLLRGFSCPTLLAWLPLWLTCQLSEGLHQGKTHCIQHRSPLLHSISQLWTRGGGNPFPVLFVITLGIFLLFYFLYEKKC